MLSENLLKPLEKVTGYKFTGEGADLSMDEAGYAICKRASEEYGLSVAYRVEQLKSGGLFNSTTENCVVIFNLQHPHDYFKYVLRFKKQGRVLFLTFFYYGSSKNTGNMNRKGILGATIRAAVGTKQLHQEEYDYYTFLEMAIREAFG
ncbi:MAG: hypothetical protein FWD82_02120 [Defluviitaleaceae bacterium]|nr:hypothetical protein [Defluviitaleaceae bacterium]